MRNILALLCALIPLQALALEPIKNDWLIVPSERMGPLKLEASFAELNKQFEGRLTIEETSYDGTRVEVTRVELNLTDKAVVYWKDKQHTEASMVCVYNSSPANSRWQTLKGVRLGLALETLEMIYHHPIEFENFGSGVGGNVHDMEPGLIVRLALEDGMDPKPKWKKPVLSSKDRALFDLGITVDEICVSKR